MKLKELRLQKGLTQSELSKLAGVKIRAIQTYEQETRDIKKASFATIEKLAKALKVKPSDIIGAS